MRRIIHKIADALRKRAQVPDPSAHDVELQRNIESLGYGCYNCKWRWAGSHRCMHRASAYFKTPVDDQFVCSFHTLGNNVDDLKGLEHPRKAIAEKVSIPAFERMATMDTLARITPVQPNTKASCFTCAYNAKPENGWRGCAYPGSLMNITTQDNGRHCQEYLEAKNG